MNRKEMEKIIEQIIVDLLEWKISLTNKLSNIEDRYSALLDKYSALLDYLIKLNK